MSDGQNSTFSELVPYCFLDQFICPAGTTKIIGTEFYWRGQCRHGYLGRESAVPGVHVGCGLVDDEDAVLPQDGSGQTHQLPLAHAEVGA